VHVVAPDDTLFQLALRYGTTVEAIMAANDIERRTDPIRVGARLIIPPR
jgi:LysM repeat protein